MSRKYRLPNPAPRMAVREAFRAFIAALTFRRGLVQHHGGLAFGAVAFLLGGTALRREGLAEPESRLSPPPHRPRESG